MAAGGLVTQLLPDLLPLALGIAVSPVPIIAVLIMVLSDGARWSSAGLALGWVVGVGLTCSLFVALDGALDDQGGSGRDTAESVVLLGLGCVFLVLAVRAWRRRPRGAQTAELPTWLATVDRLDARQAAGLGLILAVLNPKNLVILPVAGSLIAAADLTMTQQTVAVADFTVVASATVVVPVLAYAVAGARVAGPLDRIRAWVIRHAAGVITLLATLIATVLLARGLTGLP